MAGWAISEGWMSTLQLGVVGRLFLAAILGGLIGLEREISGKAAGLRTNILICVGAALLTELSIGIAEANQVESAALGTVSRADPARIAAQIVSGIGFIGAGTILQSRGSIVGLTTAATIWVVAAIGMAAGSKAYVVAIASTGLVAFSLGLLGRLEEVLFRRRRIQSYLLSIDPDPALLQEIQEIFSGKDLWLESLTVEKGTASFEARFELKGPGDSHADAFAELIAHPAVHWITRVS